MAALTRDDTPQKIVAPRDAYMVPKYTEILVFNIIYYGPIVKWFELTSI